MCNFCFEYFVEYVKMETAQIQLYSCCSDADELWYSGMLNIYILLIVDIFFCG
jgi:hypothetical protein